MNRSTGPARADAPDRRLPRTAVALFSGGRGGATIARALLRRPGTDLSLLINGYDNGLSTGALRRYLPGMLGPSDFRKNLLLHLDPTDPAQAAMTAVLEHRTPPGTGRREFGRLVDALTVPGQGRATRLFPALPAPARAAIVTELTSLRRHLDRNPDGLDLADCALGNLLIAGAYLRLGGDFNAAVQACARTFGSPVRLLNVTSGENAFLVALKENGALLADEAEIVEPQHPGAITDLFLLPEPLPAHCRADLATRPAAHTRHVLASHTAQVSLNPRAGDAIRAADLLVYGPGTPHSSLLPSYLTPGIGDAIAASRARAKVFVVNLHDDHDVRGLSPTDLVDRTLAYLGDPSNRRRTITHVLSHHTQAVTGRETWAGATWVTADLVDPAHPDYHCGQRTAAALTDIAAEAALVRFG